MILVFDLYSNGEFVANVQHEASNHKHMIDYLIGYTSYNNYVIKNMRIWG